MPALDEILEEVAVVARELDDLRLRVEMKPVRDHARRSRVRAPSHESEYDEKYAYSRKMSSALHVLLELHEEALAADVRRAADRRSPRR